MVDPSHSAAGSVTTPERTRPRLADFLPPRPLDDADAILDLFLSWAIEAGFELYPAQEEAILELMADRHVALSTPTGSGKSLVALALHFQALCRGRRSFYTSPIKALASEKFFDLCDELGAERVGMLTGDASINPDAEVVCCTAEVLANMALRYGEGVDAPEAVLDEFHYYADHERGVAWQIPLIALPSTRFLLMSATIGNPAPITEKLERRSGRVSAHVTSSERPVPLEFSYRETPLHETVEELVTAGRSPIYVVSFTRRECPELAQALTSAGLTTREERDAVGEAIADVRFDTPYGRELRRFLRFGIGVHHSGLLPKYRLTVERLAQQGLLKVIAGTDTLGVGVNVPIKTVLFTKLAKYDGRKVGILSVRDFQQIAGRAGRKGFDDQGWVVVQAPEHVVENRRAEAKAAGDAKKRKKLVRKSPPPGTPEWDEQTFERLVSSPPEPLESRFRITHGTVVQLLQRDAELDDPDSRNFDSIRALIGASHEDDASKKRHLSDAAMLVRSLHRAGIVRMQPDATTAYLWAVVDEDLQQEFSMHQALSLYLVEALDLLDRESETFALDVVSLVESILEDPTPVLRAQLSKAKGDAVARMKAEGIEYQERMAKLDEIDHPRPLAELIEPTFETFRRAHPWVGPKAVNPKSIGREMLESYASFTGYVKEYGLQRSEGILLRYLSQLYRTLVQGVPEALRTSEVWDVLGFFRAMLERVDSSLLEAWETLLEPGVEAEREEEGAAAEPSLLADPRAFTARVRAELHALLRALAEEDWDEAAASVRSGAGDDPDGWTAERLRDAMAPFLDAHGRLRFDGDARRPHRTVVETLGPRRWSVQQTLLDADGETDWTIEGAIDLSHAELGDGPLIEIVAIG